MKTCTKCGETKPLDEFREKLRVRSRKYRAFIASGKPAYGPQRKVDESAPRVCCACERALPLADFYRNASGPRGRMTRCKECFKAAKQLGAAVRICGFCETAFQNSNQRFCSKRCADASMESEPTTCVVCGVAFKRRHADQVRCSSKCATGEGHPQWKGGVHAPGRQGFVNVSLREKPGYADAVTPRARLVAARAIGRSLAKNGEHVIHLNWDRGDDRPENLFICRDQREMLKRVCGKLPWPTKSNLDIYR